MNQTEEKKLMAGLLKAIEVQTGITLHNENIKYFFEKWKQDIEQWRETASDEAQGSLGEGIAVAYANKAFVAKESTEALGAIEQAFGKWNREVNPVSVMVQDLSERECSTRTIWTYRSLGNTFMKFFDYQPEFTHQELREFLASLNELSPRTRRAYRTMLKLLWEVQGLVFPLKERRVHTAHQEKRVRVPCFSANQVAYIVKAVKFRGTPEEKYYFCLATIFAPRRIELGKITANNFTWDGNDGVLEFNPHKHGLTRVHYIQQELIPYLKDYSYQTPIRSEPTMTRKFHSFCRHLDIPIPKYHGKDKGRRREERGWGWHAFRHSIETALLESGFGDTMVNTWFGWASGSQANPMVSTYYTPDMKQLDAKIQSRHPFLKLWMKG